MLSTFVMVLAWSQVGWTRDRFFFELPPWLEYQSKVDAATSNELEWKTIYPMNTPPPPVDPKYGVDPPPKPTYEVHEYRLVAKGMDSVLLEERGLEKTVWRRSEGIRIDLRNREFQRLRSFPKFEAATWFRLAKLRPDRPNGKPEFETCRTSLSPVAGVNWPTIERRVNLLDAVANFRFWFHPESKLLHKVSIEYSGMWDRAARNQTLEVKTFRLETVVPDSAFSLDPPPGYREKASDFCLRQAGSAP